MLEIIKDPTFAERNIPLGILENHLSRPFCMGY